jgi:hypothetical protein
MGEARQGKVRKVRIGKRVQTGMKGIDLSRCVCMGYGKHVPQVPPSVSA